MDENLFLTQSALPTFVNNLALVRNSVISRSGSAGNNQQFDLNDNANRIKLLNSNIMLTSNNKVPTYMTSVGVNNTERDPMNPFEATTREDYNNYIYRNKKIRFGELMDKDRIFKQ